MVTNGIDVSQYQGIIDWEITKNEIDFAILRIGYGQDQPEQDDKTFKRNADECTRLGIPFGVYIYSYAMTPEMAIGEANHVLRLVKNYKMAYPVYYDLEDERTTGQLTNDQIAAIAKSFADTMEANKYYVGIYASLYWWSEILTNPIFDKYSKWIARYANELNFYGDYGMWQYTDKGTVMGIQGLVDKNYGYVDYPTIIPALGLNNFGSTSDVRYAIGDMVHFSNVFLTSDSSTPLRPYKTFGEITKIVKGARNPYLIDTEQGWVNDQVIEGQIMYIGNQNYIGDSFVDALMEIAVDTSLENRKRIAKLNGIYNYAGTLEENMLLLRLLQKGKLIG